MPGEEQSVAAGLRDLVARVQRLAAENPGASAWREMDHALRDFGVQDSL